MDDVLKIPQKCALGLTSAAIKFLVGCGVCFGFLLAGFVFESSRHSWPLLDGTVTQYRTLKTRGASDQVEVYYTYECGGRLFEGKTFYCAGAVLPDPDVVKAGAPKKVYVNTLCPQLSTVDPDSEIRIFVMLMFGTVALAIMSLIVRPDLYVKRQMREELPVFLYNLARHVEKGLSVEHAVVQANEDSRGSNRQLSLWLDRAILNFKINQVPIHQSLRLIGEGFECDELIALSSTLAAAHINGGSIAFQIRSQCDSLEHALTSEREAVRKSSGDYGDNLGD